MEVDFGFNLSYSSIGYKNVGQRKAVAQPTKLRQTVIGFVH